jgi:CubicO group peptidase (beta-lactamase class C family)
MHAWVATALIVLACASPAPVAGNPTAIPAEAPALNRLCLAPLAAATPTIHTEVNQGPAAAAIHEEIARRVAAGFGGAIIVELDGAVVLKAGYGWADREHQVAFTPSTIAQVGSLTKQFTATAVVDLALQGKLKFSDPLSKYLQDVPAKAAGITIHQLLTHTSGLPDDCGDDFDRVSREDLTRHCLAAMEPSPPGKFAYSNFGYSLLAAVVETVSGKPLDAYLAEHFFSPLYMTRTGYFFSPSLHDSLARGYDNDTLQVPMSDRLQSLRPDFWNLKGNGGMQASVLDMYTWYRALSSTSVIPDTMRKTLFAPYVRRDDGVNYGYGWFVRADENGRVEQVSHTGSDGVFFSAFVWRPTDRIFYYLVTNSGEKPGAEVASKVLRTLRGTRPTPAKG